MDWNREREVRDLLNAARDVIDGKVDCRTPEYAALDGLERALSALLAGVTELRNQLLG